MKLIHVNGYTIRYLRYADFRDSRRKSTLVLLHGIGASADRWSSVAPTLSRYYQLIIPDIVGFGYSDKPTIEYTMDFFVKFFEDFLRKLEVARLSIIGTSFGGYLATVFTIRNLEKVDKLILAAPAGAMRTSTRVLDQYIMAALYPTYENTNRAFRDMAYEPSVVSEETIRDFMNRMRLPNAKYAFMSTLLAIRDSKDLSGRLSKISVPTLLIWGANDRMIPLAYSREYTEIPNSQLTIIDNCGHTPFVEKPAEFNNIVLKFLER
ncbi:MAG TPA: alpha/beta hydrolase [Nitrososphaeraceae archaeon]|nr:alpha/beta hydrolase [Nitrososphaeraceae archaeon]